MPAGLKFGSVKMKHRDAWDEAAKLMSFIKNPTKTA
jgi:hypothetical protein